MLTPLSVLTPEQIVACTVWGEARGGSSRLKQGVGSVIQNRVAIQRTDWGLTPQAVCVAPRQFSCWMESGGPSNYHALMDLITNLQAPGFVIGPSYRECLAVAWQVTGRHLEDVTRGAHYYFAPAAMVPAGRVPSWAEGKQPTAVIDTVEFFA